MNTIYKHMKTKKESIHISLIGYYLFFCCSYYLSVAFIFIEISCFWQWLNKIHKSNTAIDLGLWTHARQTLNFFVAKHVWQLINGGSSACSSLVFLLAAIDTNCRTHTAQILARQQLSVNMCVPCILAMALRAAFILPLIVGSHYIWGQYRSDQSTISSRKHAPFEQTPSPSLTSKFLHT